jgi:hypothetical protein
VSEEPSKKKEEKKDKKELTDFFGFVGVIIALTMTIAWDYIKSGTNEIFIFFTTIYYFFCVISLLMIVLIFYSKYQGYTNFSKTLEEKITLPIVVLAPIFLGIIPVVGLGLEKSSVYRGAIFGVIIFSVFLVTISLMWLSTKEQSE